MPGYENTDSLDNLMDLVGELPHALALYEHQINEPLVEGEHPAIITMVRTLAELYDWQTALRENESPLYTVGPAQLKNPSDDAYTSRLFPFALNFRCLQVGLYCVVSWAMQLQIYTSLLRCPGNESKSIRSLAFVCAVEHSEDELLGSLTSLPSETIKAEADRIVRLICQCIEYCNRLEMGIFGPQTMLFTQWTMRSYFRQLGAERELSWCLNIPNMRGAPTRCGIRLMAFQGE